MIIAVTMEKKMTRGSKKPRIPSSRSHHWWISNGCCQRVSSWMCSFQWMLNWYTAGRPDILQMASNKLFDAMDIFSLHKKKLISLAPRHQIQQKLVVHKVMNLFVIWYGWWRQQRRPMETLMGRVNYASFLLTSMHPTCRWQQWRPCSFSFPTSRKSRLSVRLHQEKAYIGLRRDGLCHVGWCLEKCRQDEKENDVSDQ